MDQELKQRLIGASVIIALAIIFVPMLFDGDGAGQKNQKISIEIPDQPADLEVKTFSIDQPVSNQLEPPASDVTLSQSVNDEDGDEVVATPELIVNEPVAEIQEPVYTEINTEETATVQQVADAATAQQVEPESQPEPQQPKPELVVEKPSNASPNEPAPVSSVDLAYRVKMGSFSKQANAQKVKGQLLQQNIRSVVEKDVSRELYHVWSEALYQNKASAEAYIKAVNALKLNIGQPSVQTMDAQAVDQLAQQGQLGWVVQLGVFGAKENAIELRNKVKAAGFSGFVDQIKNSRGENRFRLRIGPLLQKSDAITNQQAIKNRLKINGLIKTHEPGKPVVS